MFPRHYSPLNNTYSVSRSDAYLKEHQSTHCDAIGAYNYEQTNKFDFSCIFGIEKYSFLDLKPLKDESVLRVLIKRGDILFIRNDVPHRGTESLSGITHHRAHVNCEPNNSQSLDNKVVIEEEVYDKV